MLYKCSCLGVGLETQVLSHWTFLVSVLQIRFRLHLWSLLGFDWTYVLVYIKAYKSKKPKRNVGHDDFLLNCNIDCNNHTNTVHL